MNSLLRWAAFLKPPVQRDVIALALGCAKHPANRSHRHPPTRRGTGYPFDGTPEPTVILPLPRCVACDDLYAAKQRVKRLLA